MSENAKDLIRSFLSVPQRRLGKDGVASIKNHPFFQNDEWTFETINRGQQNCTVDLFDGCNIGKCAHRVSLFDLKKF